MHAFNEALNYQWKWSIAEEWYTIIHIRVQPSRSVSSLNKVDSNYLPLSVVNTKLRDPPKSKA